MRIKKRFGIVGSDPGQIILQDDSITDAMRQYLRTNPIAYLVRRSRGRESNRFGYIIVERSHH